MKLYTWFVLSLSLSFTLEVSVSDLWDDGDDELTMMTEYWIARDSDDERFLIPSEVVPKASLASQVFKKKTSKTFRLLRILWKIDVDDDDDFECNTESKRPEKKRCTYNNNFK